MIVWESLCNANMYSFFFFTVKLFYISHFAKQDKKVQQSKLNGY